MDSKFCPVSQPTSTDTRSYPPTLAVYDKECDEILSWMPDWLSQDDFDRLAQERRPFNKRVVAFTGDTIVLALHSGQECLAALIEMRRAGLVETRMLKGRVAYRARA